MNNPHSSFAVLAWPFFFRVCVHMCNHCLPRRWNPDGVCWPPVPSSAVRQFSVWKGISGFQSSFFCELLIKASANTILLFLKSISNFFFPLNYGWDLLVMALRLSLLIFLNYTYVLQCKWGNCVSVEGKIDLNWLKMIDDDSELAFILSSPFFSHSFTTVFVFPLCWAEAFRNKVKKKTEWPSRNISKGRN